MGAGCARSFARPPRCTGRSCSKKRNKGSAARSRSRILRRLVAYARKQFSLFALLGRLKDRRLEPRIPTSRVVNSVFVMNLAQIGSFNALEKIAGSSIWKRMVGDTPPSADTNGRVCALLDLDPIRQIQKRFYVELKRQKALPAPAHGLIALVIDGHESTASFLRQCSGCLKRTVHTQSGDRTQYYHRYVAASLVGKNFHLFLDAEEVRSGKDEVDAAKRLLARVHEGYAQAYDVVVGDSLYARADFFQFVLDRGMDVLTVLKQEVREVLVDARALMKTMKPECFTVGRTQYEAWDISELNSWSSLKRAVRVVRTLERKSIRRQRTDERGKRITEEQTGEWIWVTTLSVQRASALAAIELGHSRWAIENQGFNEAANYWHLDHVYRHEPIAMMALILLGMIAYNLVHVFYRRNLKPAMRARLSMLHLVRLILAEIYAADPAMQSAAPS